MTVRRLLLAAALLAPFAAAAAAPARHPDDCARTGGDRTLAEGCAALDRFLAAFNARDPKAWAATLHYPHVRIAGDTVRVWPTAEDYARDNGLAELARTGWSRSRWDWRHLVQRSDDKLHFAVSFTRYRQDGSRIGSYQSLYILTRRDGAWGTQARSSYAGVAAGGKAY